MEETLRKRLEELGLDASQIKKLEDEEVKNDNDMAQLSYTDIKQFTGCSLMRSKNVALAFAPLATVASEVTGSAEVAPFAEEEIPEGADPSPAQVNNFADMMGIDQKMLSMLMFTGMAGGAGIDIDLSAFLPIPQIVIDYNPKFRNMPYMIMGQLEKRLGTPIVVINADGSVNKDLTTKYIMSLEEGFEKAEDGIYYDEEGQPYEVIHVGVDAQSIYDMDPLVLGKALAQNGMGAGRVKWSNVPLDVRQVVYFAATKTGELVSSNDAHMSWLREHIKPGVNRLVLQGQCPNAIVAFNEAARTGSLPTLRVMLTRLPRRPEVMPRRRPSSPRNLTGPGGEEGSPKSGEGFRS